MTDLDNLMSDVDGLVVDVNPYLEEPNKALGLISDLLQQTTCGKTEALLAEIEKKINIDFVNLSALDDMPDEAAKLTELLAAVESLREVVIFPALSDSHLFAIAGGFSAGKSSFVNALLNADVLPTDTRPTTSIPTLILSGQEKRIETINLFGHIASLDEDGLKAICHAFNEQYGLGFSRLLKYVMLTTPAFKFPFSALLDTPGYSKPDDGQQVDSTDRELAKEQMRKSDYILWLVDVHKGTLPADDITFLLDLPKDKKIFFVVTKADEKNPDEVDRVVKTIRANIVKAGINFSGICPVSIYDPEEYPFSPILSFIELNSNAPKSNNFIELFSKVFTQYSAYHEEEIGRNRDELELLNNLSLELYKDGIGAKGETDSETGDKLKKAIMYRKGKIKTITSLMPKFVTFADDLVERVEAILKPVQDRRQSILSELDSDQLKSAYLKNKNIDSEQANEILISCALSGDGEACQLLINKILYKAQSNWTERNSGLLRSKIDVLLAGENNHKMIDLEGLKLLKSLMLP